MPSMQKRSSLGRKSVDCLLCKDCAFGTSRVGRGDRQQVAGR